MNSVQYTTLFGLSLIIPMVGILVTNSKIWAALFITILIGWAIAGVI